MITLLLFLVLVFAACILLHFARHRRRLGNLTWSEALDRAERINLDGLKLVAESYLLPDKNQLRLEPEDMFLLMGGFDGLKQIRRNVDVILDLAIVADNWNRTEARIIGEMLRRDAVRLRRAALQFELRVLWSSDSVRAPFYLQEIASSYCLMRARLLGLYENAHVALVPQLQAAL